MPRTPALMVVTFLVGVSLACGGPEDRDPDSHDAHLRDGSRASGSADQWLDRCDANGNGRVTCREARAGRCGAPLPVTDDHPLYQFMTDRDRDGSVCE